MKEKRGRCECFSKSDFSWKQRSHLSEQRAVETHREFRQLAPWQAPAFANHDPVSRDTVRIVSQIKATNSKSSPERGFNLEKNYSNSGYKSPFLHLSFITQPCTLPSPDHKSLAELPNHKLSTQTDSCVPIPPICCEQDPCSTVFASGLAKNVSLFLLS